MSRSGAAPRFHPPPLSFRGAEAIVTLTEICADLRARPAYLGTLAIEHDVPFKVVGPSWGFDPEDARQLTALWHAHVKKCQARGLRRRGIVLVASAPATLS